MSKQCWVPLSPDAAGKYLASSGGRYAALLSVDSRAKLSQVVNELKKQDFVVTYAWQSGQVLPTRNETASYQWLAGLPPPTQGTVWMYLELNYVGDLPRTIARTIHKCVLFICGTATLAYVFELRSVGDTYQPCNPGEPQNPACPPLPPPAPGCPPEPSPWLPALAGAAVGAAMGAFLWRRRC